MHDKQSKKYDLALISKIKIIIFTFFGSTNFSYLWCSKWQAFKLATLSGFAEPLGVIIVGRLTIDTCLT